MRCCSCAAEEPKLAMMSARAGWQDAWRPLPSLERRWLRLVGLEPGFFHASLRLRVLHKGVPYKIRAEVLGHQHGNSRVNADHVGVVPACYRIESVDEAV